MGCHPDGCEPCSMPRHMRGVECPGPLNYKNSKQRKLRRGKMPANYRQKQREAKRKEDLDLFEKFGGTECGFTCRHIEDPEGSQRWVETGRWEE